MHCCESIREVIASEVLLKPQLASKIEIATPVFKNIMNGYWNANYVNIEQLTVLNITIKSKLVSPWLVYNVFDLMKDNAFSLYSNGLN